MAKGDARGKSQGQRVAEANALFDMAERQRQYGQTTLAIESLRRAVQLAPHYVAAHNNLATLLRLVGHHRDAIAHYRLAIKTEPGIAALHFNLAKTLEQVGQLAEAELGYRACLDRDPEMSAAEHDLGVLLQQRGALDEAIQRLRNVVNRQPQNALGLANLATALRGRGDTLEAFEAATLATTADPQLYLGWSNQLCMLPYLSDELPAEQLTASLQAFDTRYGAKHAGAASSAWSPERTVRIGYVSADFRDHAVTQFFEPVAEAHDRTRFAVYCYDLNDRPDQVTARLRAHDLIWRECAQASDAEIIQRMRDDAIDVLVDLMGHTARNRLTLYAARRAKLQIMWMGWPGTTGLSSFDYVVSDPHLAGTEPDPLAGPEQKLCLPHSWICYRPHPEATKISPVQRERAAPVVFGSFNGIYKLRPPVLKAWIEILQRVSGSSLIIAGIPQGQATERLRHSLLAAGLGEDRFMIHPPLPLPQFFALQATIDLSLDPWPFNGLTTTLDTLWVGKPVLTLAGRTHAGRMGASIMANLGLQDFIATDAQDYVDKAVSLASTPDVLRALSSQLRARMQASPLMDAAGFTRAWEQALMDRLM